MIVVRVELWPGGDESRAKLIGKMDIANVSDLADVSDYNFVIYDEPKNDPGILRRRWSGTIYGHDRRTSIWGLIGSIFRVSLEADEGTDGGEQHP